MGWGVGVGLFFFVLLFVVVVIMLSLSFRNKSFGLIWFKQNVFIHRNHKFSK